MELFNPKNLNFNFVKLFKPLGIVSVVLTILSIVTVFFPGLNYGIDFRGGLEARITFKEKIDIAELRALLEPKVENLSIVEFNEQGKNEYLIVAQSDSSDTLSNVLTASLTEKYGPRDQAWSAGTIDVVGPKVGSELRTSALLSLLYTCILITLYMYWRFDFRFSPGALAGIFHDLALTVGFLALTGTEFSTTIVAALLTLAGYSINDTVVVYDRIREIEGKYTGRPREQIVNDALNSTLSRTLMTSTTTIISCIVLYILGGTALQDFAFTMLFGIVVGTYSSVFIASPLYIWADKRFGANSGSLKASTK